MDALSRWRWQWALACALLVVAVLGCKKDPPPQQPPAKPYQRANVVDFHAHLSLDGADRIAQIMQESGISLMINLSGGSARRGTEQWEASQQLAKLLHGKIVNFAMPNWKGFGEPGWAAREAAALEVAVRQFGFRGMKITKGLGLGYQDEKDRLIAPDDPRLQPLWEKAGELGIPVSIHTGDPRAFWWPLSEKNERWDELGVHPYWAYGPVPTALLQQFEPQVQEMVMQRPQVASWTELLRQSERMFRRNPKTTYVAVHFGNCGEDLDYVDGVLTRNPNVYIDTAARVGEFGRHPAEQVRAFFIKWQDRIVFGTDIGIGADGLMLGSNGAVEPTMRDVKPFYDAHWRYLETTDKAIAHPSPIQGRWTVDAIGLPGDVLDKLYHKNAEKLLDAARLKAEAAARTPARQDVDVPGPSDPWPAWALAMQATTTH